MRLIDNWQSVAGKSWSFRCHAAGVVLYSLIAGALMFWPALQGHVSLYFFCFGAVALNLAGGVLRLVDQGLD